MNSTPCGFEMLPLEIWCHILKQYPLSPKEWISFGRTCHPAWDLIHANWFSHLVRERLWATCHSSNGEYLAVAKGEHLHLFGQDLCTPIASVSYCGGLFCSPMTIGNDHVYLGVVLGSYKIVAYSLPDLTYRFSVEPSSSPRMDAHLLAGGGFLIHMNSHRDGIVMRKGETGEYLGQKCLARKRSAPKWCEVVPSVRQPWACSDAGVVLITDQGEVLLINLHGREKRLNTAEALLVAAEETIAATFDVSKTLCL